MKAELMNDLLNTPTGAGKTCAGGHRFVLRAPKGSLDYTLPAGARCECGAVEWGDLPVAGAIVPVAGVVGEQTQDGQR